MLVSHMIIFILCSADNKKSVAKYSCEIFYQSYLKSFMRDKLVFCDSKEILRSSDLRVVKLH